MPLNLVSDNNDNQKALQFATDSLALNISWLIITRGLLAFTRRINGFRGGQNQDENPSPNLITNLFNSRSTHTRNSPLKYEEREREKESRKN